MPLEVVTGTVHRDEDYGLAPEVVEAVHQMEQRHFWHAARNDWILAALRSQGVLPPARFLEVGCGRGAVAVALAAAGYRVTGVDTSLEHVQLAERRDPEIDWVVAEVANLPERVPYQAIGFFDVLEHLDDPSHLVEQALSFAAPSALILATVPGDPSMFSAVDELSGHKRRYEPGEPSALLASLGLRDVVEYGLFRVLQPAQRWLRRNVARSADRLDPEERIALMRSDLAAPAPALNAALRLTCFLEQSLGIERAEGRPGASLLAVGRMPNDRGGTGSEVAREG